MRLIIIATDLADKESEGKDISEGRERGERGCLFPTGPQKRPLDGKVKKGD